MRKPIRCSNLATLFLLASMALPASVVTSGTVTVLRNSGGVFNLTVNSSLPVSGNLLLGNNYQSFFLSFLISESLFLEVNRLSFDPLLGFVALRFF